MSADAPAPPASRVLLALLLLTIAMIAVDPGRIPLFEPDEGRYAEIPREMLATRDFVTPRLNGVLYFEKPPLHYWSVAASFALLGLSELAARVPAKLASIGLVLLTFLFARRRHGERVALLAAVVVATSALVFSLSRINLIDPSLSLALAASAFAFAAFQEAEGSGDARRARRALYALHAACAAAVLLKGLIGIVLPGGAILVWAAIAGRLRLVPRLFSPLPLLLFLVLTVPWHVLVAHRNPGFLDFYFVHEHFARFATKEHRREGSPLYFVAVLLGGFLPWTAFLGRLKESWPGTGRAAWHTRGTEGFLFVFALIVFLFFSASRSKLIPYLEPIWPAVALLLALGIERARERGASFELERRLTAAIFGLLLAAGLAFALGAGYAARFGARAPAILLLAGLLLGFVWNLFPRVPREVAVAVALPWTLFLFGAFLALPRVARVITPWPLVSSVEATLRPGDHLVQRGHYLEVLPFYARRLTPVSALGWSELDFGRTRDAPPGSFPTDEEFVRLWNRAGRVLAVVHRDRIVDFSDPRLALASPLVLARDGAGKHFLLANRP